MDQGTSEWLEFRKKRIGASEASIIMGISEWGTPYSLWLSKTGRTKGENKGNWATERGNRCEPMARARYELKYNTPMPPKVVVHPEFDHIMASLDGENEVERRILEIKIPSKEVFELAKAG